jgi:hypothetical protein
MTGLDDRQNRLIRAFLYHYALNGMWHLVRDGQTTLDARVRDVVAGAAGNSAMNLWQILPTRTAATPGGEVVRSLRMITAATLRDLPVAENDAEQILSLLGMEAADAPAALTVLEAIGGLGGAWTSDPADMARAESAAAVTAALVRTRHSQVAARLYNAAVSLIAATGSPANPLRARMLLNALGLRWALIYGSDLIDAMDEYEGLDCAFAFLRAARQYEDERLNQGASWPAVTRLMELLAELPRQLPHDRPGMITGLARLSEIANQVRQPGAASRDSISAAELAGAVAAAIDEFRSAKGPPASADQEADLFDTAALIGMTFTDILGNTRWGLREAVDDAIRKRTHPDEEFIERYLPYTEPEGVGTGPPVAAEAVDPAEWHVIESSMLRDPGSLVSILTREFV